MLACAECTAAAENVTVERQLWIAACVRVRVEPRPCFKSAVENQLRREKLGEVNGSHAINVIGGRAGLEPALGINLNTLSRRAT